MKRTPVLFLLLALSGCGKESPPGPFGMPPALTAAGDLYYLASATGRLGRIAPDGTIVSSSIGPAPQALAASGDGAWVVALSPSTSTLWAAKTAGSGPLAVTSLPVRPNHNAVVLSPGVGHYAITYVDLSTVGDLVVDGTASFNEITVVNLDAGTAATVVVGFDPQKVVFTPDGTEAVVLSESFASLVPLASPAGTVRVPLGANTAASPVNPETALVTADGKTAVVALQGRSDVFLITLSPPSVNILDFGLLPTRFVASSDGKKIVALAAGASGVAVLDLASSTVTPVATEGPVTDVAVPSDPADARMLLWAGDLLLRQLYKLDLGTLTASTVALVNPPVKVGIGPDGAAVVLQQRAPASSPDPVQQFFSQHESLSVLDRRVELITPVALDAPPTDLGFFTDLSGRPRAVVTLEGSGHLALVDLGLQIVDALPVVDSPAVALPLSADPRASAPVAIVHDQPFGTVTFLAPDAKTTVERDGFLLDGVL